MTNHRRLDQRAMDRRQFLLKTGLVGAAGLSLPALLAAHFATRGEIWAGVSAPAWLAQAVGWRYGFVVWTLVLLTGFAILALTQVGIVEGFARNVTDILWTARARASWSGWLLEKLWRSAFRHQFGALEDMSRIPFGLNILAHADKGV